MYSPAVLLIIMDGGDVCAQGCPPALAAPHDALLAEGEFSLHVLAAPQLTRVTAWPVVEASEAPHRDRRLGTNRRRQELHTV